MAPLDGQIPYIPGEKSEPGEGWVLALGIFVSLFLVSIAWLGIKLAYEWLSGLVTALPREPLYAMGIGVGIVVGGGLLYLLRCKWRAVYAYLELGAGFGMAVEAWLRIGPTSSTATLTFTLLAATYVIVRAFDNLAQALEQRRVNRETSSQAG